MTPSAGRPSATVSYCSRITLPCRIAADAPLRKATRRRRRDTLLRGWHGRMKRFNSYFGHGALSAAAPDVPGDLPVANVGACESASGKLRGAHRHHELVDAAA